MENRGDLQGVAARFRIAAGRRSFVIALTVLAVLALSLGGAAAPLFAEGAAGKPLVHNYNHRDFGAEVQAWDVVQGDSGLMYFANNAGVLEYDGRTWRLIELPSHLDVRSLL